MGETPSIREQRLERLLIDTMNALHVHVVHCGTILENRALEELGYAPPETIYQYKYLWASIAEQRGQ